jgi:hypothetical protein
MEEREAGVLNGFNGNTISWVNAIKFTFMGAAVVSITYYGAYSIGETIDQLLGWFDAWIAADRENSECTQSGTPGCESTAGASLAFDLGYHSVTLVYSWFLYTFMIFAAHWYAS